MNSDFYAFLLGKTQCGTRGLPDEKLGPYILNGNIAKVGAWPWQVEILFEGRHKCGGTIIDDRWILTAAHCSRSASIYLILLRFKNQRSLARSLKFYIYIMRFNNRLIEW